ncbi:insulinase family protein [Tepidibacter formicigenes]|jgi:Zn-dependent M16 (insulinase) family peptidase|uniref:Peptidase M16C associated domain-containing protein n=1 Tax=Tepidibacter formicigenes DSM 15518 TaxID=1123349 RepID=A0A1M6PJT7_9FIRM|nr:insulinase family protein [Tepidibacter formicigenes]SHK08205.1 hypothetical protein SAMN02744037_01579 [Tepidibacter formicigenes DSM 15518]
MRKYLKSIISILVCTLLFNGFLFGIQIPVYADSLNSQFVENNIYSGFNLKSKRYIEDIQSTLMEFNHIKSGAKLYYLQNKDNNKRFSISFKTPPTDNTGVNHIIEHSVLCGSKKYPVKDPFLLMKKQSLQTFLNAMTAADYTTYPVASKNEKDLENLMSVYLDAVFYPNIYSNPKIFKQEGWHYELESPESEIEINGIVYSEMKGAYSSPYRLLFNEITKSLYPDTIYKYESGGNPDEIPNLTYEKFIDTHKKYYVPSNSCIFLYGNLDIEKELKFIDKNYLSKFDKKEVDTSIKKQNPLAKRKVKIGYYPIPKDSDIKDKTYLSLNYAINNISDEDSIGMSILSDLLTGSDYSPLKKALKENNIGLDSGAMYDPSYMHPTFSILVENANEQDKEKFEKIVDDTLRKVIKEGFDEQSKNKLESIFNSYELVKRAVTNSNFKGQVYEMLVVNSWLYDQNPIKQLQLDSKFKTFKGKIDEKYFENLIQKYLLNNNHSSLVVLKPKQGLEEENIAKLKNKLSEYKSKLSKEEIDNLVKETQELKKWQETPDSKEAIATVPTLSLSDLNTKVDKIPTVEKSKNGIKILSHSLFTNGIDYTKMYFDTSKVPQDKLLYLSLLSYVLGDMDTDKSDYMELEDKMDRYIGGISFDATTFRKYNSDKYEPRMVVDIVSLNDKLPYAFEILDEIINHTKFTNKEHLREIIQMQRADFENNISNAGMGIAISRAGAYISDEGKYNDYLNNIDFYKFICDLDDNFDRKYDEIVKNLDYVNKLVFNKENLIVSYTGDEKGYLKFEELFNDFSNKIKDEKYSTQIYKFDDNSNDEGFIIPSKVQYIAKVGKMESDFKEIGKLMVLKNILDNDYLWQEVRVKGGAYGGGVSIRSNSVMFVSWEDPNLKETLNIFDKSVDYLKNFNADEREMTNFIIGTFASLDTPADPDAKAAMADSMYISETPQEELQKIREEVLSTTAQDIRNYGSILEKMLKESYNCVVGAEEQIQKNKDIFDNIKKIVEN